VPGIIISILGFAFINTQRARSQAILINIRAFKTATATGAEIPRMLQLLNISYEEQVLQKGNARSLQTDTVSTLRDTSARFEQAARQYQQNYQISTSPRMSGTNEILLNDDPRAVLARQQRVLLDQVLNEAWPDYHSAQERALQAIAHKAKPEQIAALLRGARTRHEALQLAWSQVTDSAEQTANTVSYVGPSQTDPILLATLVAFLSTILVVTAIGYIVYLTIVRPLHQLALLTKQIGRGDMQARATIKGHDEISLVATSMNSMLDSIVRLLQEAQMQRDILQAQAERLVSEVSGISEGDLRVRAEISSDALGVLATSFNYMIEELGSLVVRVKGVASEVARTTIMVQQSMTHLVETGQGQLSEMGEAAHEVEVLAVSNRQVADRSHELYDIAHIARRDAQTGREAVYLAINGIKRINENVQATASKVLTLGERSREINEIVEAISGIAHQTNRLALDAAIQAAMAGENGKGFGAVAADIRRLAERSKSQAGMISQIVRGVREDIDAAAQSMQDTEKETTTGSQMIRGASEALEAIFAAVEHQAREIEHIYQMATQQLQSSNAIAQIVQRVSDATRSSSASTEEASQQMERLMQLVEQLRTSVEAFKLRDDQSYYTPGPQTLAGLENPLTVSGVFRTVHAHSQPIRVSRVMETGNLELQTPMPQVTGSLVSFYTDGQPASESGWAWDDSLTEQQLLAESVNDPQSGGEAPDSSV
jgi:methyl-accepting chemotaxis protein